MKLTLTTYAAVDYIRSTCPESFSREGAEALVWYLEELEEEIGEEIELDPIALRCDWSEYKNYIEAAQDYAGFWGRDGKEWYSYYDIDEEIEDEDDLINHLREWFNDRTTVIEFDSGVIIQSF